MEKKFLTGNEAAVLGAIDAGAEIMFGYPITPATEILEGWITNCEDNKNIQFLQTEDEIAAGFGVVGAILAGVKSFTASAGPGHILLQDPLAMAENMRLPFVGIMMQRGGPSTGTVNFSQQEVNLAAFGGNGDGLRIVYSVATVEEMYRTVIKAFSVAWKYRFPTLVLGDGYLGKMKQVVALKKQLNPVKSEPILKEQAKATHIRNCFSSEEDFGHYLQQNIADWKAAAPKIADSESFYVDSSKYLIIAHGLIAGAALDAVKALRKQKVRVGLFRPITLNPMDTEKLRLAVKGKKKVFIIESSLNQLSRLVKYEIAGMKTDIVEISKPAQGITADEIITQIRKYHE